MGKKVVVKSPKAGSMESPRDAKPARTVAAPVPWDVRTIQSRRQRKDGPEVRQCIFELPVALHRRLAMYAAGLDATQLAVAEAALERYLSEKGA